ncbi:MAG TPA: hypothetical protein VIH18_03505 [Candidatus Binatia bacterium]
MIEADWADKVVRAAVPVIEAAQASSAAVAAREHRTVGVEQVREVGEAPFKASIAAVARRGARARAAARAAEAWEVVVALGVVVEAVVEEGVEAAVGAGKHQGTVSGEQ